MQWKCLTFFRVMASFDVFSREWNLIPPMHNYEISSTIPENWKLISLTVSENTSGQNDTQNFTKTSIYDVIIWRFEKQKNPYKIHVNIYHPWKFDENRTTHIREIACTKFVRKKKIIIIDKKLKNNNKVFRWKRKTLIKRNNTITIRSSVVDGRP